MKHPVATVNPLSSSSARSPQACGDRAREEEEKKHVAAAEAASRLLAAPPHEQASGGFLQQAGGQQQQTLRLWSPQELPSLRQQLLHSECECEAHRGDGLSLKETRREVAVDASVSSPSRPKKSFFSPNGFIRLLLQDKEAMAPWKLHGSQTSDVAASSPAAFCLLQLNRLLPNASTHCNPQRMHFLHVNSSKTTHGRLGAPGPPARLLLTTLLLIHPKVGALNWMLSYPVV
ncbi:hypothetical protein Efla_002149 [Eimeria flavescens]